MSADAIFEAMCTDSDHRKDRTGQHSAETGADNPPYNYYL